MSNLCIIPARGGSKRIPRKNIRDFLGKPIIAYSIEAALKSGLFDEVMVSTDDKEIAEIAKKFGASVPFMRSTKNSDDFSTLNEVVKEVLQRYDEAGNLFSFCCCILPTAPLISVSNLKKAYQILVEKDFDSVRPIVKFDYPVHKAFSLDANNKVTFLFDCDYKARSQDFTNSYHDAGQFYWMRRTTLLESSNRGALVINELEAHDIDSETDWIMAEMKYNMLQKQLRK